MSRAAVLEETSVTDARGADLKTPQKEEAKSKVDELLEEGRDCELTSSSWVALADVI